MSQNSARAIRPLTDDEIDAVSGANILIYGGPVVAGFAAGVAIRAAVDKFVDWLFD